MKGIKLLVIMMVVWNWAFAQSIYMSNYKTITGWYRSGSKITIDGNFDEAVWTERGGYNMITDSFTGLSLLDQNLNSFDGGTNAPTAPPAPPASNLFTAHVTFALSWDKDYLYMAVSVIDTTVKKAHKPFANANAAIVFMYFGSDNTIRSNGFDGTDFTVFYPNIAYDDQRDFEVGFAYCSIVPTQLFRTDASPFGYPGFQDIAGGIDFNYDEYISYFRPTSKGYHIETALSWKALNKAYVFPGTDNYDDNSKRPSNGRAMAFDLINNIPKPDGSARNVKMGWNACCANRNYLETINFGTLVLQGPVGCDHDGCNNAGFTLTTSSSVINGSTPTQLSPVWINANYTASINFSVAGTQLASVDASGLVTPLGNGVVTIVGTSSDTSLHGQSFKVLTITNISLLESLTLQVDDISANFGSSNSIVTATPSQVPNTCKFVLDPPTNLAVVNSVTGVVTATAYGNGSVTVKAISLIDTSVFITRQLSITNQDPPQQIYLMATIDSVQNCSSSPYAVTISGGGNESFGVSAFYCNSAKVITTIPSLFISYKVSSVTGISNVINGSSTILNPAGTATITGTYLFNTSITASLGIVLKRRIALNCPYNLFKASLLINCESETSLPEELINSFSVYPNPSAGIFNVNNETSAKLNFSISNLIGNVLLSGELQKGTNSISFKVQPGVYFLRAGQKTTKIYIE